MASNYGQPSIPAGEKMTATFTTEAENRRALELIRPFLWDRLKTFPMTLAEFDKLATDIAGIVTQHYREGAYHGDIDAKQVKR